MANPVHFYHVYADGAWQVPTHEHFAALRRSGFRGALHVGMVGKPEACEQVERYIVKYWGRFDLCYQEATGYEQGTIAALAKCVTSLDPDTPVLYCHTKGAWNQLPENDDWREQMTEDVVTRYATCLALLEDVDAVGPFWVTPEEFPEFINSPFFGGNFWWAKAGYLAKLPPVKYDTRFEAEAWVGYGNPKIVNLRSWPPTDHSGS